MPTQHIVATRHNVQDPCRMRLPKVVPGTAVASVEGCGKASARCYNLVGARGAPHHWGRADMRAEILSVGTELLRSEEHTSELQSLTNLVCRLLLEKKKKDTAVDLSTLSPCE